MYKCVCTYKKTKYKHIFIQKEEKNYQQNYIHVKNIKYILWNPFIFSHIFIVLEKIVYIYLGMAIIVKEILDTFKTN